MAVNPRSSTPVRALPTQGGAKELPPAGATGRGLERVARVINPGGWAVESERPIATLLGSCVAVCLIDPQLHLAGMNHFLLPSGQPGGSRRSTMRIRCCTAITPWRCCATPCMRAVLHPHV